MHGRAVKNVLLVMLGGVLVFGCKARNRTAAGEEGAVKQIADMSPSFIKKNWTCKMLAYDFDKYYPRLLTVVDKMSAGQCLSTSISPSILSGKAVLDVTAFVIENENIPDLKGNPLAKSECGSEYDYALESAAHLNILKKDWQEKKCRREALAHDLSVILDSEACISPCGKSQESCHTCTPENGITPKFDAPGTITCGSEDDARGAVQDFCAANNLKTCDIQCASVKNFEELIIPVRGIAGTIAKVSDKSTVTVTASFDAEAGAGLAVPIVSGSSVGGDAKFSASVEASTLVEIESDLPYIWVKNVVSPTISRQEAAAGVTYSCSIKNVKLNKLEGGVKAELGLDLLGFKLKVGGSTNITGSDNVESEFTRNNLSAAGKIRNEIIDDCKRWAKELVINTSLASADDRIVKIASPRGLECIYKNDLKKAYDISYIYFKTGAVNTMKYQTAGVVFDSSSPEYEVSASAIEKLLVPARSWQARMFLRREMAKFFNAVIVPASAGSGKWELDYCGTYQ